MAEEETKKCPFCAEIIKKEAIVCRFCGHSFEERVESAEKGQPVVVAPLKSMGISIILTVLLGPLGMLYSTIGGGFTMIIASLVVAISTVELGFITMRPICIIWLII